jgi:hypothetical protein
MNPYFTSHKHLQKCFKLFKVSYINALLLKEQQARLATSLYQANCEEANDLTYQQELALWEATLADG